MIDAKDQLLLNLLLEHSRLSFRAVAQKAGMSVVSVIQRMRKLEQEGVIMNYSCRLNYEKLGYELTAIIQLRISKGKLFEVEQKIATHPNIIGVYDVTGNFDSLVIAKFRSRKSLDGFLKKIQTYDFVERTETNIVLNTIMEKDIRLE